MATGTETSHNAQEELLEAAEFWARSRTATVVDVRSPAEFHQGHLPDAINIPLFDDLERAEIGTIYKNSGREDAVLRGLAIAGPKMADMVKVARQQSRQKQVFVHCWRGGMRSGSVGWLFQTAGMTCRRLDGGYKAFRALVRSAFSFPWDLRIVSGLTGAGKTDVLHELARLDQQVVDLEGLAHHRGSAFGSIGQAPQPTTEQFENNLFEQLDRCDPDQPVWMEDEGNRLGTVVVPPELVHQIRNAPAVFIERSAAERVERLLVDYGQFPDDRLLESLVNIRKRLGPQHADAAGASIRDGDLRPAVEVVLDYYDRTYLHAAEKMPRQRMMPLATENQSPRDVARRVLELDWPTSSAG